jgi:hypothetical protein
MVKKKKGPNFEIWLEAPKKFGPALGLRGSIPSPNCFKVPTNIVPIPTNTTTIGLQASLRSRHCGGERTHGERKQFWEEGRTRKKTERRWRVGYR